MTDMEVKRNKLGMLSSTRVLHCENVNEWYTSSEDISVKMTDLYVLWN